MVVKLLLLYIIKGSLLSLIFVCIDRIKGGSSDLEWWRLELNSSNTYLKNIIFWPLWMYEILSTATETFKEESEQLVHKLHLLRTIEAIEYEELEEVAQELESILNLRGISHSEDFYNDFIDLKIEALNYVNPS